MTQEQILKKAIEKAESNGYKRFGVIGKGRPINYWRALYLNSFYKWIFDHNFAKAFFGIGERVTDQDTREELYQFEDGKFRGMQNYTTSNLPA